MRVAVTGGSGFIGARVVERLKEYHDPVVIDRASGIDVTDPNLPDYLDGVQAVIHLAGVLGTAELFDAPMQAVDVNVKGALNVLQACRRHGARYVGIAMPECWPNVYQATKLCARRLATAWHLNFGVPVSHVRAFNAYGPEQKFGPGHPQKIIPTFAVHAWQNRPIPIWGDGEQRVDLVHVDDIAHMMVDAMAFGRDEMFDAGTGTPMTVNEVAYLVLRVTGSRAGIQYLPMRDGETKTDVTYARGEGWDRLAWRPRFDEERLVQVIHEYRKVAVAAEVAA